MRVGASLRLVVVSGLVLMQCSSSSAVRVTTWQPILAQGPQPRSGAVLSSSGDGSLLLFGGSAGSDETWLWSDPRWRRVEAPGPPGRKFAAVAFDSRRERIVMFGGIGASAGRLPDTWEWDGARWIEQHPAKRPAPRAQHAMAYDAVRERVVLFGGYGAGSTFLDDTWEWDGVNWSERMSSTTPLGRRGATLTFVPGRGEVILFGGRRQRGSGENPRETFLNDSWSWDGVRWSALVTEKAPPRRESHAMAYAPALEGMLLYGGYNFDASFGPPDPTGTGGVLNDTWRYSIASGEWTRMTPASSPPGLRWHAMATGGVGLPILFGGESCSVSSCSDERVPAWRLVAPSFVARSSAG